MMYADAPAGIRTPLYVCSMGKGTMGNGLISTPTSSTVSTDLAYIVRIVIPTPTVIRRLFWSNGATAGTNTVQVGIYKEDLTSLLLGTATTASGTSQLQFDNVTDTFIGAGRYWMAIVANGTTTTLMRLSSGSCRGAAIYQMASARPLPATLAPQVSTGVMPLFGFTSIA